jgi:hypothetical protein
LCRPNGLKRINVKVKGTATYIVRRGRKELAPQDGITELN